ncbi:MAG TPA: SURF1 family protein [Rhizomicrobium sp.]|nr:SURF1 family protein [Rhizomicrobium sp.]
MFRPLLKPTLWFLPMFAVLVGLGTWQIERLHWKEALIEKMNANISSKPLPLDEILKLPNDEAQYRHVVLEGSFDNAKEAYAFGTDANGTPVFHVLTPFILSDGRALIVDRGIVPQDKRDPKTREAGQLNGPRRVTGIWRTPDPSNLFTPEPDLARREWFSRDVEAMAKLDGLNLIAPVVVEADATPNPGGWPKGGQTVVSLPNNHLQYAITWYLMAVGLLAVYLAYHRQRSRLGRPL